MKKLIVFLLVLILPASSLNAFAADNNTLPAPDWVTETLNPDASKTVTVTTPLYLIDHIDYYEYSTDGFETVHKLGNKEGGEFIFDKTTEFSLRYSSNGIISPSYTVEIIINKITVITSLSTNISILIPYGSPVPTDITLSGYEIISGKDYTLAQNAVGENKSFRLYSVSVMRNNKIYKTDNPYSYLFPANDFDSKYCKIYSMDSQGKITLIDSFPDMNMLSCETEKTGYFLVVEDKIYRNGDLNGDGNVLSNDARLALRISAMLETPTEQHITSGDINKNGKIDAADARMILRAAASLEKLD